MRAGEVGVAHSPKWRRSLSIHVWDGSKNDCLGSMHTSDHRRSVWYKKIRGFTLSCEALGRLLKKKKKKKKKKERKRKRKRKKKKKKKKKEEDENSKIAHERFLV